MGKLKVAILGTGNIGTDLLIKVLRSPFLECTLFTGRNLGSKGMLHARSLGVNVSDGGVGALAGDPGCCDLVFDATTAIDHQKHWAALQPLGKIVIDMTPSRVGRMNVPAVDLKNCLNHQNVNMVSCGGQASVPLAHVMGQTFPGIEYIEVVSSIASRSAGPGTRINIDEYVETTEEALKVYSGCPRTKTILILNPADPCIHMQTTISAKVKQVDLKKLEAPFEQMLLKIRSYVPGYTVVVPPTWEMNRIVISVRVTGRGDYLPVYAGNLDIINCAALATAEEYARQRVTSKEMRGEYA